MTNRADMLTHATVTAVIGKFTTPFWLLIVNLICFPLIEVWMV